MKVRGDKNPGKYSVAPMPKRSGFVLARFFENAQEYTEETETGVIRGWEYDEYQLELPDNGNMELDIAGNYGVYLADAKLREAPTAEEIAVQNAKSISALEDAEADADALTVDHELRLTLLELGLNE